MATTIYKSNLWHVRSFGTELATAIAQFDADGDITNVWVIDDKKMASIFSYSIHAYIHQDSELSDGTRIVDAFLVGFTLAADTSQLRIGKS